MQHTQKLLRFAFFLVFATYTFAGACATRIEGKIVHIDDGDTVIMMTADYTKVTVRLSDIDAPESSRGQKRPGQPYSSKSTDSLKQMVWGRQGSANCYGADRYGRQVCRIYVDGLDVNSEQVKRGMAWANRANARYVRDPVVYRLEDEARKSRAGLWSSSQEQVQPWIWRKTCWEGGRCEVKAE
jgi:micrococcal nuclease